MREHFDGDAYRTVYGLNLGKAIYVLHVFIKKSKSGIALPRPDIELIEGRLQRAKKMAAED